MAISQGSPFGKLTGKLGSAVGFSWKDKNAVRSYAIPANPQTQKQQAQRGKMGFLVSVGKQILTSIIQPFWDHKARGMSGFNLWLQTNLAIEEVDDNPERVQYATGSLEPATITTVSYNPPTGVVEVVWSPDAHSNGLATDKIACVVYDMENKDVRVKKGNDVREQGSLEMEIPPGKTAGELCVHLFAWRLGSDGLPLTSTTDSKIPS